MTIYEYDDYKEILRALTNERRNQFGLKFTFEKMALACGIQKTYLSKVLNGSGQLSADQLFAACEFLKINDEQTEFILLIREWQLAQNSKRKKHLNEKIARIRKFRMKTVANIKTAPFQLSNDALWEYHTDFDLQLIHVFLTIPKFAANPNEIGPILGIEHERITASILRLEHWGLLHSRNGLIELNNVNTHLPDDSPIIHSYRLGSRLRAIEYLRKQMTPNSLDGNYSLSVLFSSDSRFQRKLRLKLLELVKETHTYVSNAKPEEVYLFNIDLLKWS
jgi:uncharacterized protein (TIGR02147 family)